MKSRSKKKDGKSESDVTWDMPVFYLYLGVVNVQKAEQLQPGENERAEVLDKALEFLNKGMVTL